MNPTQNHQQINDWLPQYAAATLLAEERRQVESHLHECDICRADLAIWQSLGTEINHISNQALPPSELAERTLARLRQPQRKAHGPRLLPDLQHIYALIKAQAPLVRGEIWASSAIVMAIGYLMAVIAGREVVITALAPLIAAACIAAIYGPDNDPSIELALSTPTSPRQVLLARLVLVFGYNLILAVIASAALLPVMPGLDFSRIILSWLGPMTFLSTLALVLSQMISTSNAISIAYAAWFAQFFASGALSAAPDMAPALRLVTENYYRFWTSPALLLIASAVLIAAVTLFISRQERSLPTWA